MAEAPAVETWESLERIPHPKIRAFAEYWQSKRGQRRAPARADIDPAELGPFLPHMYMLDVVPPGPRVKVRLLGTEAMQSGGVDYTGRFADEVLPPDRYAELQREVDDVLQHFVLRYRISDLAWQGRPHARYHRLMMPRGGPDDRQHPVRCRLHGPDRGRHIGPPGAHPDRRLSARDRARLPVAFRVRAADPAA